MFSIKFSSVLRSSKSLRTIERRAALKAAERASKSLESVATSTAAPTYINPLNELPGVVKVG